jgi:hypothetical protein
MRVTLGSVIQPRILRSDPVARARRLIGDQPTTVPRRLRRA